MILTPLPLMSHGVPDRVMSILMGLIAEMLVRTYFESQQRAAYSVRNLINFDDALACAVSRDSSARATVTTSRA